MVSCAFGFIVKLVFPGMCNFTTKLNSKRLGVLAQRVGVYIGWGLGIPKVKRSNKTF